jgi:hypothetical protein
MANIAIRLDDPRVAALDALRTSGDFAPSRNAYAAWLLGLVLDVGREGVDALLRARLERLGAEVRRPRAPVTMEGQPVDEMPAPETDGARLLAARRAAGLTQAALAENVGVSESRVRRFEGGGRIGENAAALLRAWMREREGGAG